MNIGQSLTVEEKERKRKKEKKSISDLSKNRAKIQKANGTTIEYGSSNVE